MALTESLEVPLGTQMPPFELKDPYGRTYKSDELYGEKGLLVVFTCNHCPYAQAIWPRLVKLAKYARNLGVETVAINPNIHPDYPEDAPDKMIELIEKLGLDFPYLVDETQETARAFKAQCTPDIYLFDKDHKLVYHGRFDDNWKDENAVKSEDLKEAIESLVEGKQVKEPQFPSMGCSIKWRE
jgi:peroxiredoxin